MIGELGRGSFGKVFKVMHIASKKLRAVKVIEKRISKRRSSDLLFFTEVDILRRLDHPNILSIHEVFEDTRHYYVVSELCEGGELFGYITKAKKLDEEMAADVMRQVLSAVAYCHEHNIVHRDLKPENILLDTSPTPTNPFIHLKLIDFGTSCFFVESQQLTKVLGTPYYIAPEVLGGCYDAKCDVWSCGVILYILLCGFPPFGGTSDEEIMKKVRSGRFSFQHKNWKNVSSSAKSLLSRMLYLNPATRPSAIQCLQDPWLQFYRPSPTSIDLDTALIQLQSFTKVCKLRLAMLSFLASQHLQKENELELAKSFRDIDRNGDGKLSREELLSAYEVIYVGDAEAVVDRVMRQVDIDNSGYIDYTEFLVASARIDGILSKDNLKAAFDAFDLDHSGKISSSELKTMLGAGTNVSPEIWDSLIKQADQNGDGEIEYSEFVNMMLAT